MFPSRIQPLAVRLLTASMLGGTTLLAADPDLTIDVPGPVRVEYTPAIGQLSNELVFPPVEFSANLNETGSIAFTVIPTGGRRVAMELPANQPNFSGTIGLRIRLNFFGPLNTFDDTIPVTATVEFLDLVGTLQTGVSPSANYRQNGNQVNFDAVYLATGPISFRGIRIRIDGPFSTLSGTFDYDSQPSDTYVRFLTSPATTPEQFVSLVEAPESATTTPPTIQIQGSRVRKIAGRRAVIRGTALAGAGLARVEFKAGRAKFRKARGREVWRAIVRLSDTTKRLPVRFRAVDLDGRVSPTVRVRVLRKTR